MRGEGCAVAHPSCGLGLETHDRGFNIKKPSQTVFTSNYLPGSSKLDLIATCDNNSSSSVNQVVVEHYLPGLRNPFKTVFDYYGISLATLLLSGMGALTLPAV